VVDRSAKKLIITPAYWVFRHFSQYIQPGAVRIGTSGSDEVLAFINPDGFIITQVYNKDDVEKDLTIGVSGGLYRFTIPAHSWATLRTMPPALNTEFSRTSNERPTQHLQISMTPTDYRISLPASGPARLELLTLSGILLKSSPVINLSNEISLSRRSFPSGLFLLRVVQGKAITTTPVFNTF
jgi:hypothetical protein